MNAFGGSLGGGTVGEEGVKEGMLRGEEGGSTLPIYV
jgi:hypothetical protein